VHPKDAIRAHQEGNLPAPGLMRALASWDRWRVPAIMGTAGPAPRVTATDDGPWLAACSDADAYGMLEKGVGGPLDLYLELRGHDLMGDLSQELAGFDVDPFTEHAIHWRREQLPTVREMARAAEVERILRGEDLPASLERLYDYKSYRVVVRAGDEGQAQWMMAPDTEDRLLLAVFTAEDTVQAFLEAEVFPRKIVPVVITLDGRSLFERIRAMWLHGICFNPRGPVPAKALSAQLAQVVLDRAGAARGA